MKVRRAVILAAGFGTRMLPATKAVPKEMLPLIDTPVIEYTVEEAVASGIEQVVIVTAAGKRAIEDHFGRVHDLEQHLASKRDEARLQRVHRGRELAEFLFVRQHEMGGIGHAVMMAEHAIGGHPFVLYLPDDVIAAEPPATRQILDVFEERGGSVVLVEHVPPQMIPSYGIIAAHQLAPNVFRVDGLVEKPTLAAAPSDLGIIGRYVFTPAIFDAIRATPPGANGELQITDAMQTLRQSAPLYARALSGTRFDIGQPLGYLRAGIELMLRHPEYGPELSRYVRELAAGLPDTNPKADEV